MNLSQENIKKCHASTKKNIRCSKSAFIFWYCKQHWNLKTYKNTWFYIFLISVFSLIMFSNEIKSFYDNFLKKKPEPVVERNFKKSEEDGNYRGIVLKDNLISNDQNSFVLGIGPLNFMVSINYLQNGFCLEDLIKFTQEDCTIYLKLNENRILLTMDFYDLNGDVRGRIENNQVVLNKDNFFTYNYDDTAFEVINNKGDILFYMEYIKPNYLVIIAVLYDSSSTLTIVAKNDSIGIISRYGPNHVLDKMPLPIKEKFKYTGDDWLNKRVDTTFLRN